MKDILFSKYLLWTVLLAVLLMEFVFILSSVLIMPVIGWDVLSFWGSSAAASLLDIPLTEEQRTHMDRHSGTGVSLIAWSLRFAAYSDFWLPPMILLFLFACVALIYAYRSTLKASAPPSLSAIAIYLFISTPLMLNHFILLGYMDFVIACCYLIATASMVRIIITQQYFGLCAIISLCSAVAILNLKNIGVLYIGVLVLAFLAALLCRNSGKRFFVVVCGAVLFAMYFVEIMGVIVSSFPQAALQSPFEISMTSTRLEGFGYVLRVGGVDRWDVFLAVTKAVFANASFSMLGVLLIASIGALSFRSSVPTRQALLFVFFSSFFGVLLFVIPCHFSNFYYWYAQPQADTGLSRFLLAPLGLVPLLVPLASKSLVEAS